MPGKQLLPAVALWGSDWGLLGFGGCSRDALGLHKCKKWALHTHDDFRFTCYILDLTNLGSARMCLVHFVASPNVQGGRPTSWAICGKHSFDRLGAHRGTIANLSELGKSDL